MVDRKSARRGLRRLEYIKTWQLLVVALLLVFVSATFLRLNNVGMVERRDAVLSADKAGDSEEIANRLYELQVYSAAHMNAAPGDVYLTNQYNRDSKAIIDQAMATQSGKKPIAVQAYDICRQSFSTWSQAAVQCVSDEVARLTPKGDNGLVHVDFPDPNLYRHSYFSPLWSLDFAGVSLLLLALVVVAIIARIVAYILLKILVKWRYKSN